jgi:hypothetical protein
MLICGENTNPLARFALMAEGEQVHISSYPPAWPTRPPEGPGNYDLAQAIRIRAGAHAFEAKVFNLVASSCLDRTLRHAIGAALGREALRILEQSPGGTSVVLDPTGTPLGASLCREEGILYAEIDLARCVEPKQFHDVVGSYNRFDIFRLSVDRSARRPATFLDEARGPPSRNRGRGCETRGAVGERGEHPWKAGRAAWFGRLFADVDTQLGARAAAPFVAGFLVGMLLALLCSLAFLLAGREKTGRENTHWSVGRGPCRGSNDLGRTARPGRPLTVEVREPVSHSGGAPCAAPR